MQFNHRQYQAVLRNELPAFIKKSFYTVSPGTEYLHNWHIDCIAHHLSLCEQGKIKRLIINIPPRYLKSISVNVAWPAWLLGHNPSKQIISASYSQALAIKHSVDTRLIINSEWYRNLFPYVKLVDDFDTKGKFVTTKRGHRIAASVGSAIIGEGGDFLIVDDPLNAMEATSEIKRQTANDWFDQSFSTRLNNKKDGVIVVIMQRLHENDLTGHLLAKGGWHHLKIPSEFNEPVTYNCGRYEKIIRKGDLLHPNREPQEVLEQTKKTLGSYAYAGQYLQEPAPLEGGLWRSSWLKWYDGLNRFTSITQSWDTAIKVGTMNDYSVCTTWGESNNQHYLLDCLVEKLEYPALKRAMINQAERWHPQHILVEDKASGQQVVQDLRSETKLPIIPIQVIADKITRFVKTCVDYESGRIYFPKNKPFVDNIIHQLSTFPNSTHDDIVDSISQYLNWIKSKPKIDVFTF